MSEMQVQQKPYKEQKKNVARFLYLVMIFFACVFVVSVFFGRIVFFPVKVEGPSMQPTLNAQSKGANDRCDTVYVGSAKNVSRGDIIVFNASKYVSSSSSQNLYVKRAIGLPGDTIYFAPSGTEKNGKIYYDVYINGVRLEEDYIKEPMWHDYNFHTVADNDFYLTYVSGDAKFILGEDEYFLMGDNRNNSSDSRFLGPIQKADFVGKVYLQIKHNQTIFEAIINKIF